MLQSCRNFLSNLLFKYFLMVGGLLSSPSSYGTDLALRGVVTADPPAVYSSERLISSSVEDSFVGVEWNLREGLQKYSPQRFQKSGKQKDWMVRMRSEKHPPWRSPRDTKIKDFRFRVSPDSFRFEPDTPYVEDSSAERNFGNSLQSGSHRSQREVQTGYFLFPSESWLSEWVRVPIAKLHEIFSKEDGNTRMNVPFKFLNKNCTEEEKGSKRMGCYRASYPNVCLNTHQKMACYQERIREHCDPDFFELTRSNVCEFKFPAQDPQKVKKCIEGLNLERADHAWGFFVTRYDFTWNPFSWGTPMGTIFFDAFKKFIGLQALITERD